MQDSLRRLLMEKREALRQLVNVKRTQIREGRANGTLSGAAVTEAELNLLAVELELAQSRPERIAVLEKMAKEAKNYEDMAKADIDSGVAPAWTRVEARLKRLNYQIKLEEEKAKKP